MPKPHHSISYRLDALPDAQPTVSKQWQQQQQALYSPLSGTTRVSWNQKKHSSTHHPDHHPIFMSFFHLLRSIASSIQFAYLAIFCTTSLDVLFWSISWSGALHLIFHTFLHPISVFFLQHMSITSQPVFCQYYIIYHLFHHPLFELLTWKSLSFTLTLHIHLTILISARWKATSFSFLTGQVSLLCSIVLRTQLLYSLPLIINDISLLVCNGTNCLNLFHPIWILASMAASASPSTLSTSPR